MSGSAWLCGSGSEQTHLMRIWIQAVFNEDQSSAGQKVIEIPLLSIAQVAWRRTKRRTIRRRMTKRKMTSRKTTRRRTSRRRTLSS